MAFDALDNEQIQAAFPHPNLGTTRKQCPN